ncbi:MAG TPA: hypothetical protein VFD38_14280 [Myxococcaceae bacterium]|nr:hypothetical protein [Myxococcaceae bacterium]
MRHLLPFDGARATARLAALVAAIILLALIAALRPPDSTREARGSEPASRVSHGASGLDDPGPSAGE